MLRAPRLGKKQNDLPSMQVCGLLPVAPYRWERFSGHAGSSPTLALPCLRQAVLRLDRGHHLRALRPLPSLRKFRTAENRSGPRGSGHAARPEALSRRSRLPLRPLPAEVFQRAAVPAHRCVDGPAGLTKHSRCVRQPARGAQSSGSRGPAEATTRLMARPGLAARRSGCRETPAGGGAWRDLPDPYPPSQNPLDASARIAPPPAY